MGKLVDLVEQVLSEEKLSWKEDLKQLRKDIKTTEKAVIAKFGKNYGIIRSPEDIENREKHLGSKEWNIHLSLWRLEKSLKIRDRNQKRINVGYWYNDDMTDDKVKKDAHKYFSDGLKDALDIK